MSKWKKILFVGVALLLVSGCSKEKASSKTEDGKLTFDITRRGYQDVRPPANDLWMFKEREKDSGIKINFEEISGDALGEKKNVLLSSKEQPDAYYQVWFSQSELAKYGSQGLFIPLEDLIDEHAPNLKKIFDEKPEYKIAMTQADGHIYDLPYIGQEGYARTIYINKVWLDELGMEVPKTLDEYYKALKAFVDQDMSGTGQTEGWYNRQGGLGYSFERVIMGGYGLLNGGQTATDQHFMVDGDEAKYVYSQEEYKDVLRYIKKLWDEGLIHEDSFSDIDESRWFADAEKGMIGSYSSGGAPEGMGKVTEDYVGIQALEGPNGMKQSISFPTIQSVGTLVITRDSENPGELIKWLDYMYGEEGIELGTFGKEGVTFNTQADGTRLYIDEILNYKDGIQLGSFQWVDNVYGGGYPYKLPEFKEIAEATGKTEQEYYQWADDESHGVNVQPEVILPNLAALEEENTKTTAILSDLDNFITQSRVKFVTGEWDIDKDWSNFVEQLEKMGVKEYMEIKQTQYDRYLENLQKAN